MDQVDIQKFARICGMLSSPHDGERASAALLATNFLSARKLTWEDLILAKAPLVISAPHWSQGPKTDREWVVAFRTHAGSCLTTWEADFLKSVLESNRWPLSPKQKEVLARMREKYGRV